MTDALSDRHPAVVGATNACCIQPGRVCGGDFLPDHLVVGLSGGARGRARLLHSV